MNYAKARDIDVADIPVIDVGPLAGGNPRDTAAVGAQMRAAAEHIGFFYICNHGIAEKLIRDTDAMARRFFALPPQTKIEVAPIDRHRGFLGIGQAKMYKTAKVDLKESFVWGRDTAEDDPDYLAGNPMIGPNRWPAALPGMRPLLDAYFDATHACARTLLQALAVSLGAPADYFIGRFSRPISRGALVWYPPQPPDAGEAQFGVAPHTDYGVLTLLRQDTVGGLQVATRRGEWVTAHPIEGTLVVNSGDLLGRWSNDCFKSNPHRVVNSSGRERLSIAMFVDPDHDTPIVPVLQDGAQAAYAEVGCGEYIIGRMDKAFAYRNKS